MATYIFHRLIKGKVLIGILFLQKCLLSSPLRFMRRLSKLLNSIGCQGDKKGYFLSRKMLEHLLRNHKVDEADTLHTSL